MSRLPAFRWTVPNVLSLLRMACVPVMVVLALLHQERAFVGLFVLAQITDILDGLLARLLRQETEIGALLDSYADLGSYIAALAGLAAFHRGIFAMPYAVWTGTFLLLYLINLVVPKVRFGRLVAGLHLYSSKITGYLQGAFLVVLFVYGMVPAFFYLAMIAGMLSQTEAILINLSTRQPAINARGIYWLIKNNRLR